MFKRRYGMLLSLVYYISGEIQSKTIAFDFKRHGVLYNIMYVILPLQRVMKLNNMEV